MCDKVSKLIKASKLRKGKYEMKTLLLYLLLYLKVLVEHFCFVLLILLQMKNLKAKTLYKLDFKLLQSIILIVFSTLDSFLIVLSINV